MLSRWRASCAGMRTSWGTAAKRISGRWSACCTTWILSSGRNSTAKKRPSCCAEIGADDAFVHAVCSHGYGLCSDVEPVLEMEKVSICRGRADGPCRRGRADAPLEERAGYGAFQPEEEIQGQEIRRGLLPRRHPPGRGTPRLGAGQVFWTARCRPCGPARMILRHRWPLCKPFLAGPPFPAHQPDENQARRPRAFSRRGACLFSCPLRQPARPPSHASD